MVDQVREKDRRTQAESEIDVAASAAAARRFDFHLKPFRTLPQMLHHVVRALRALRPPAPAAWRSRVRFNSQVRRARTRNASASTFCV